MEKVFRGELGELAKLVRYWVLRMTTEAGSGHPTSCLSAVELMVGLMFGGFFRFKIDEAAFQGNDRLIFSKGHASPLFYALWAAAKRSSVGEEELLSLRKFGSRLEGHPTLRFPFVEAATGSLGQGLSVGVGIALAAKLDKLKYRTWVLLGDSEMAEGAVWEAVQLAAYYKLDNLVGIVDINRLGQRGETMYGWDVGAYERRMRAFGWKTIVVDGHSEEQVLGAYERALEIGDRPVMVLAKTVKGKGVAFLENQEGWHGKPLSRDQLKEALMELGKVDRGVRGEIAEPGKTKGARGRGQNYGSGLEVEEIGKGTRARSLVQLSSEKCLQDGVGCGYRVGDLVATRRGYGRALVKIFPRFSEMVVLDAEVSNSTRAQEFKKVYPERFREMFIAEQNMVGVAWGLSRQGKIPFVSTFAAFFTRAFDQVRMSEYSKANIKFVGSHAGVSIGEDGPSQMGLEDLAMFRTLLDGVVLCPADVVACEKLVEIMAEHEGIVYLRTTRMAVPVIYSSKEEFKIGGSKVLRKSGEDVVTVVGVGITLREALTACEKLGERHVKIRVIDLYSIKPLDGRVLKEAVEETGAIITVEDHFAEGGLGEAVMAALAGLKLEVPIYSLAVRKMPRSGKPEELLDYEGISSGAIVRKVEEILANGR